jgi:hypothetical protein
LVFESGETSKEVEVKILDKEGADEDFDRDDVFAIRIFNPEGGVKISKKDICYVNIVSDKELLDKMAGIE